ncbi:MULTISPECIES: hypothetical protein [unclassified Coleofasciculus]|uniref:hypothetical protein n=1 Tax=unclassified Coleofasciculus TaxID=2692782 RepID=UPI001881D939|nr:MULTISPECIES: hypothetical protein [unclassified Coleofasciculus]MBE9125370.1 hypothetical protein [Coleofasciculus sp. LEGE 07081]MBE9147413.1 hypothetical protein [Coleofasciculus sp. LEGE 07092]
MADIDEWNKSVDDSNSVWSNLQGLEITKGELKHLTGFDLNGIPLHKPLTLRRAIIRRAWLEVLFISLITICFLLIRHILWLRFSLIDTLTITNNAPVISIGLSCLIATVIYLTIRKYFANKRISQTTIPLLEEVCKYNQVAKIVEVQSQIEAVGNSVELIDKKKISEALDLTRADLVCALKTERILRESKDIINMRPELFANNLASLRALDVSEKAGESGQLINEALQVAIGVQEEIKKLHNQRK